MWQTFQTFDADPQWGLHVRPLAVEAGDWLAGKSLAACIGSLDLIRVSGPDAETFLQGQTTCDFHEIGKGAVRLGAHCNVKGRAQASFLALKQGEDFILLLPQGLGEPTRAALTKYALFSKVSLALEPALLPLLLSGISALEWAAQHWGQLPETGHWLPSGSFVLADTGSGGLLVLVPADQAPGLLAELPSAGIALAGDNVWWLSQLAAGIGWILPSQSEVWIPQEFNLDLVGGISFKKGCYKGQEIIARIHYRGQTKVRAQLLEIQSGLRIEPGIRILDATGQPVGTLLQAALLDTSRCRALAVLKVDAQESGPLALEANESSHVQLLPLPYAITN